MKVAASNNIQKGIGLCRQGLWLQGMFCLSKEYENGDQSHPGLFYSYFGYGIAFCENRVKEGIALCERAIEVEWYEPDNFYNLARTYLLADNRGEVYKAIRRGLCLDPGHLGLHALAQEVGMRRKPVFPFLSRTHPLNKYFGIVRHKLFPG